MPITRRRDGVDEVVEVVAVRRPLDPAHAGERAVERVAEPVDDEQRARRREPGGVAVGEHVGRRDAERSEHAEQRQVVGSTRAGTRRAIQLERARLRAGEQGRSSLVVRTSWALSLLTVGKQVRRRARRLRSALHADEFSPHLTAAPAARRRRDDRRGRRAAARGMTTAAARRRRRGGVRTPRRAACAAATLGFAGCCSRQRRGGARASRASAAAAGALVSLDVTAELGELLRGCVRARFPVGRRAARDRAPARDPRAADAAVARRDRGTRLATSAPRSSALSRHAASASCGSSWVPARGDPRATGGADLGRPPADAYEGLVDDRADHRRRRPGRDRGRRQLDGRQRGAARCTLETRLASARSAAPGPPRPSRSPARAARRPRRDADRQRDERGDAERDRSPSAGPARRRRAWSAGCSRPARAATAATRLPSVQRLAGAVPREQRRQLPASAPRRRRDACAELSATPSGPRNSIVTATPSGIRAIASKKPAPTRRSRRRARRPRRGPRARARAGAGARTATGSARRAASRSATRPAGPIRSNSGSTARRRAGSSSSTQREPDPGRAVAMRVDGGTSARRPRFLSWRVDDSRPRRSTARRRGAGGARSAAAGRARAPRLQLPLVMDARRPRALRVDRPGALGALRGEPGPAARRDRPGGARPRRHRRRPARARRPGRGGRARRPRAPAPPRAPRRPTARSPTSAPSSACTARCPSTPAGSARSPATS